jgi:hypothetical protein
VYVRTVKTASGGTAVQAVLPAHYRETLYDTRDRIHGTQVRTSWPQLKSGSGQGGGAYTPPGGQGPCCACLLGSSRATLYLHCASRGRRR